VVVDEMDSFMYQTVGHEAIELIAESMGLPLLRREINGNSKAVGMGYDTTEGDEVEDLLLLLQDVLAVHPDVQGVSVGAILSNYQRIRVEHVCARQVCAMRFQDLTV
jgi:diphthine-ammonia ligase